MKYLDTQKKTIKNKIGPWLVAFYIFGHFLLICPVFAGNPDPNPAPIKPKPLNQFFCPPTSALQKDFIQMTWSAESGNWKSYGISFEKSLTQFWGAQWNGTIIGQITCIYHAEEKTTFPVLMIYHALTLEPKEGKWSKNLGGVRNCVSHTQTDCPFQVRLKPQEQNIYEEAGTLKKDSGSTETPGF